MKEWLLLSQPPGCLCSRTSFPTLRGFGTLAAGPGCFPLGHGPYQPQPDCCAPAAAFGVWLSLVPGEGPAPIQCSTSVAALRNASPKAISGSTSYLQACLVFRSYPVRPSTPLYRGFSLDKDRSPGFGSAACNLTPSSGSVSLRLRDSCRLTSLHTATRRFILQKARHHPSPGSDRL